jgi:hypothetical protein
MWGRATQWVSARDPPPSTGIGGVTSSSQIELSSKSSALFKTWRGLWKNLIWKKYRRVPKGPENKTVLAKASSNYCSLETLGNTYKPRKLLKKFKALYDSTNFGTELYLTAISGQGSNCIRRSEYAQHGESNGRIRKNSEWESVCNEVVVA